MSEQVKKQKCKQCGSWMNTDICDCKKQLILVSFSGGRTSAYMSKLMLEKYPKENLVFVFANTGQEHPKTLEFVQKVDEYFSLDLVWVEAVVHSRKRMGTTHRIVNYESATRDMSLFKAMSYKFGIPGPGWLHCTRELKERPIHSFIVQEYQKKKMKGYKTAIGIRADEIDRCDPNMNEKGFIYPLCDDGVTKKIVIDYWSSMPFDLEIPDYLGNCTFCWKKSNRKLKLIAQEHPEYFKPATELEQLANYGSGNEPRKMFRGRLSASDILTDVHQIDEIEDVIEESCGEHCEPFVNLTEPERKKHE